MKIKTPEFDKIAVNAKKAKRLYLIAAVLGLYAFTEGFIWRNWLERASSYSYKPKNIYDRFFDDQYGWPVSVACEFGLFFIAIVCWQDRDRASKIVLNKMLKSRFPGVNFYDHKDIERAKLMAEYILGLMTNEEKQAIKDAQKTVRVCNEGDADVLVERINKITDTVLKREYARNPKIKDDLKAIAKGQMYVFSGLGQVHGGR